MHTAILHFHGELAPLAKACSARVDASRRASLKDWAESLGVPHTEIYAAAVEGQGAGLGHVLTPGQRADLWPGEPPVDTRRERPPRPALASLRFLADANVGRLATYLRLLGFDTAYARHLDDDQAAAQAVREGRVLLTRDRGLLRRSVVAWGRLVRANDPVEQARDTARFFGLAALARPFTRCLRCNALPEGVDKVRVLNRLEPRTRLYYEDFARCPGCGRVYWAGSHHGRMVALVRRILD